MSLTIISLQSIVKVFRPLINHRTHGTYNIFDNLLLLNLTVYTNNSVCRVKSVYIRNTSFRVVTVTQKIFMKNLH